MSKRDYKTTTGEGSELEPLGGPKSADAENSKTNGLQFGEYTLHNLYHNILS